MIKLITILLVFFGCSAVGTHDNKGSQIEGLKYVDVFPMITPEGKIDRYLQDSFFIFKYQDMVLYKLPYYHTEMNDSGKPVTRLNFSTFIYKTGNLKGYFWHAEDSTENRWCSVDSLLTNSDFTINARKFHKIFEKYSTNLVQKYENKDSATVHEMYSGVDKNDTTVKFNVYLSYMRKPIDFDVSLSYHLDSINKMKLYYVEVVTPAHYDAIKKLQLDTIRYSSKLILMPRQERSDILTLFTKFSKLN